METKYISLIKRLAMLVALMTLVLVGLGGYVRATGAGLACPDWPLCFGMLVPEMRYGVIQEVFHRYLAAIVSVGVLALTFISFKFRKESPRLFGFLLFVCALLLTQVVLGGLTVLMKLNPFIVTGHLIIGTVIVQSLLLVASEKVDSSAAPSKPADSIVSKVFYFMSALLFVQIGIGGFVGSSGASMACPEIPFCDGLILSSTFSGPQMIQMIHRVNGVLIALLALSSIFIISSFGDKISIKKAHAVAMFVMIMGQVLLGFANVVMSIPVAPAVVHLVLAQLLLFGYLVPARRLSGKRFFLAKAEIPEQTFESTNGWHKPQGRQANSDGYIKVVNS